ncbi:MAG: GNAT family N-acetyltransferase [Clostridiales bacterium]|nr:GNAT family N-acetyltransferase [Clostridiales bacterium]
MTDEFSSSMIDMRDIFMDLPVLETEHLFLRKVEKSDARDFFEYASDEEVAKHVLWYAHQSIKETRRQIKVLQQQYRHGSPASFAIIDKKSGRMIGTIGYMWVSSVDCSAEIGYSLSREYWNRGFMTEALREIIRFSFDILLLNRVEAQHGTDNPASGKVMEKCGMKKEGILRQRLMNKGKLIDTALYSILRDEYYKGGQQL